MPQSVFPSVRVGDPIRHETLSVFPLFPNGAGPRRAAAVDYALSDEAIGAGSVVVEEVSESGSVPQLRVVNKSRQRVLFLEGEELRGAKQNRVLNTTVLVGAESTTTIPVSCVEQGRWHYRGRGFRSPEAHSSSQIRYLLKKSTSEALSAGRGHTTDQLAVWSEVERTNRAHGTASPTHAYSDTFERLKDKTSEYLARLKYVDGAVGVAVAIGPRVVAFDLFDKPETCRKVWDRLLSGVVVQALEPGQEPAYADSSGVSQLIDKLNGAPWASAPAVGEGQELRSQPDNATSASALVLDDCIIHASAMVCA